MTITVEELRGLAEGGATILNVGKHAGELEIRGAVRYRPRDLIERDHLALPIADDRPVVFYDEHGTSELTREIAAKFVTQGFDARVLEGGFEAWETAGGPTQESSLEQIVPL